MNTATEEPNPWKDRILTVPNVICMVRIAGSPGLIVLAAFDMPRAFVVTFVLLSLSDWVDGKLARWLNQRSDFGARLDSVSDAVLYTCLLIGCLVLKGNVLQQEAWWLLPPLLTYAMSIGYGLWKYSRPPSYHTQAAKTSYWLVLAAGVSVLLDYSAWPLRITCVAVTLTNLEAVLITRILPTWQADVRTFRHAIRHHTVTRAGDSDRVPPDRR
ncbi:MAG: CDP-alcohol phosphatidyltransferase family protein [Planctomycetaceae bacterium]|nr:CDP-alcohol phosphatidyltransferase family protein [Planctomycetaceae bacterium]